VNHTQRKVTRLTIALHIFAWLLVALIALAFITGAWDETGATAMPTPAPMDGHCMLIVDGDTCYIVTLPGCGWVLTKFGENSMGVALECDPVKQ
jgi:hypothetical protein